MKSEHGKVQLGNITVDMVKIHCSLHELEVANYIVLILMLYHIRSFIRFCHACWKVLGGMRGMTGLLWDASLVDPEEVGLLSETSLLLV